MHFHVYLLFQKDYVALSPAGKTISGMNAIADQSKRAVGQTQPASYSRQEF